MDDDFNTAESPYSDSPQQPVVPQSPPRIYTIEDMAPFDLLEHPIHIFDIENKRMWWANQAALRLLWQAPDLPSLLARDFASDMSEATERRLHEYVRRFQRGDTHIRDRWTYYPKNGTAGKVTANLSLSPIHIGPDNHIAMINECDLGSLRQEIDQTSLRGVEMLRHLPVAVSQFDIEGRLMDQNPEALDLFGGLEDCIVEADEEDSLADPQQEKQDTSAFVCRFVDRQLGKEVLLAVQRGDDYKVEAQQYTVQRRTTPPTFPRRSSSRSFNSSQCSDGGGNEHTTPGNNDTLPCWFAIKVRRSRDPVTQQPVILYSARDITEVIQAKNEADQANMEKSEMLAVLAHEIRTPLHQVVGFIDMLEQTHLSEEQTDYVHSLQSSTVSLMTIINDVLDYTRLEAGKLEIEEIPFDPRGVCESCVETTRSTAEKKGLTIQYHFLPKNPVPLFPVQDHYVTGDPNRIRQILLNLLSNAVKFSHRGTITLSLSYMTSSSMILDQSQQQHQSSHGGHVPPHRTPKDNEEEQYLQFVVADMGVGICREHLDLIFKKYTQANAAVTWESGGTGLGLSICKTLAEAMGGTLTVQSQLNVGSRFTLRIPIRRTSSLHVVEMDESDSFTTGSATTHGMRSGTTTAAQPNSSSVAIPRDSTTLVPLPPRASSPPSPLHRHYHHLRVLVAEDNRTNQKLVKAMLGRAQCEYVTIVDNGQLAVNEIMEQQARNPYHLILMDVQMPVLSGIEATRQIRSLGWSPETLVIIGLTASFQTADLPCYLEAGMNDCIGKPVRLEVLKAALDCTRQGQIERQQQQQQVQQQGG